MKLPGINYQTAVGPDVSALPLQEARAWSDAANNWATAIQQVDETMSEQAALEAVQRFTQKVDAVEDQLRFNPVWNVSQMGEPPESVKIATRTNMGKQASYQTHEFAGSYYDHVSKEAMSEFTQGLSPKAARIARTKMLAHTTQRRSYVLEEQYKRKKDFAKGSMLNSINTATANARIDNLEATILTANQMIANGINSGTIGMEEGESLRVKVLDEAYFSATLDSARRAGSDADLDALEMQALNSPMTTEKLSRALSQIDARRTAVDREEKDRHDDNFRVGIAGVMSGDIVQTDIPDLLFSDAVSAQQGISMYKLAELDEPKETDFKDPANRNYWSGQISKLRFNVGEEETLRERNIRLQKDINAAATGFYNDGTPYQGNRISQTDAAWALGELDKEYNKVLSHPEMKQVLSDIRTYTGMDGIVDIDASSNNRKAQLAFNRAAWAYYGRMGVDANMHDWFDDNKATFNPENYGMGADSARLKSAGVPGRFFDGKDYDPRAVSVWLEDAEISPERKQVIQETLMPMEDVANDVPGNAVDIDSLIEIPR